MLKAWQYHTSLTFMQKSIGVSSISYTILVYLWTKYKSFVFYYINWLPVWFSIVQQFSWKIYRLELLLRDKRHTINALHPSKCKPPYTFSCTETCFQNLPTHAQIYLVNHLTLKTHLTMSLMSCNVVGFFLFFKNIMKSTFTLQKTLVWITCTSCASAINEVLCTQLTSREYQWAKLHGECSVLNERDTWLHSVLVSLWFMARLFIYQYSKPVSTS